MAHHLLLAGVVLITMTEDAVCNLLDHITPFAQLEIVNKHAKRGVDEALGELLDWAAFPVDGRETVVSAEAEPARSWNNWDQATCQTLWKSMVQLFWRVPMCSCRQPFHLGKQQLGED